MKLVIRSANHKQPDFPLELDKSMVTVKDLKLYLSKHYPDNPDPVFMKMIFKGHLLSDLKRTDEIFSDPSEYHVVHLVCLPKISTGPVSSETRRLPSTPSLQQDEQRSNDQTTSNNVGELRFRSNINVNSDVRQPETREINSTNSSSQQSNFQINPPNAVLSERSDVNTFGDWYTRYYSSWLLYLSVIQAHAAGTPTQVVFQHNQNMAGEQQANVVNVAAANRQNRENGQVNAAAAGGLFEDDDDDGRARDLLDWVYIAVRAGILLSLIYLYSSIPRIVALVVMLASVWLLRTAIAGFHNNNNNNNNNQEPVAGRQREDRGDAPNRQDGAPDIPNREGEENAVQPIVPQPVPLYRVVLSAIAGFFLSLFPDAPGLQQQN